MNDEPAFRDVPAPPAEEEWTFVEELKTPLHGRVAWVPRGPRLGEAAFPAGLTVERRFDDPSGLLETAYADFNRFLGAAGIPEGGPHRLVAARARTSRPEEFRVATDRARTVLEAADTEGIRRGLVWLEDEMLRRGGPVLPLGRRTRTPWVRDRISRCFFGPVNRPPKSKDELADDVDYYPEEYLNRLAHQGVNGIWLTVHFFNTVPSAIIPEYGRGAEPRLARLRRTVEKCARYGIRIFPFCIEPAAFTWPQPELAAAAAAHPDLRGHNGAFCTGTPKGKAYLEEATRTLFTRVPGLGGMIVIPCGERLTHCHSGFAPSGGWNAVANTCPRCGPREPREVLADTLSAMVRGIRAAGSDAPLISWPYGQLILWGEENAVRAAAAVPEGVVLQHNFETGGRNLQRGRLRTAWDYWLSYVGPSRVFARCAAAAGARGTRMSAKLQVGCSHEVCTTQVVPVPGLLHRKFAGMKSLGVSAAMLSWYFGAYPSLMTKAAGDLSFAPFPRRGRFLLESARRDWGPDAPRVARAWRLFASGYSRYPTAHIFGYFGPMHDGPAWPLFLEPRRLPLAATWQLPYPPSGDYIAQCVTNGFTLDDLAALCGAMAGRWERGMRLLSAAAARRRGDPERSREIGLWAALGLQFASGHDILRFYGLREDLAESRSPARRLRLLARMRDLVRREMGITDRLLPLCEADSRLGFHSEAEGHKYYPARLRWRRRQLETLLAEEFPAVEARALGAGPLFPAYTGEIPTGPTYACARVSRRAPVPWEALPEAPCGQWLRRTFSTEKWKRCPYDWAAHEAVPDADRRDRRVSWKACRDGRSLHFRILATAGGASDGFTGNLLQCIIEPSRTLPRVIFQAGADGTASFLRDDGGPPRRDGPWRMTAEISGGVWAVTWSIPYSFLRIAARRRGKPLRMNVVRTMPAEGNRASTLCSWVPLQPAQGRLVWEFHNPATDFGWLLAE